MDIRSITTVGKGVAPAVPDAVVAVLAVEVEAPTPAEALTQCGAVQAEVLAALGVTASATALSVRPGWDNERNRPGKPTATSMVTAALPSLTDAGAVVTRALEAGGKAVRLESMSAVASDTAEAVTSAQQSAIAAARSSAQTYAAAVGGQVGRALEVSEATQPGSGWRVQSARKGLATMDAGFEVPGGAQDVTVQVTVTWELLD
jgi:uncharacterized protein YggE